MWGIDQELTLTRFAIRLTRNRCEDNADRDTDYDDVRLRE